MLKITQTWEDFLYGCPSQSTLYFMYNERPYEVYLRWRWQDPWDARLIDILNGDEVELFYDGKNHLQHYYSEEEIELAKEKAMELTEGYLNNETYSNR